MGADEYGLLPTRGARGPGFGPPGPGREVPAPGVAGAVFCAVGGPESLWGDAGTGALGVGGGAASTRGGGGVTGVGATGVGTLGAGDGAAGLRAPGLAGEGRALPGVGAEGAEPFEVDVVTGDAPEG